MWFVTGGVPLPPHPASSAATTHSSGTPLKRINPCRVLISAIPSTEKTRQSTAGRLSLNCRSPASFCF
jgi:hypothetical protein